MLVRVYPRCFTPLPRRALPRRTQKHHALVLELASSRRYDISPIPRWTIRTTLIQIVRESIFEATWKRHSCRNVRFNQTGLNNVLQYGRWVCQYRLNTGGPCAFLRIRADQLFNFLTNNHHSCRANSITNNHNVRQRTSKCGKPYGQRRLRKNSPFRCHKGSSIGLPASMAFNELFLLLNPQYYARLN